MALLKKDENLNSKIQTGIKTEIWRNGAAKQKIKMPVFKNDIEEEIQEHEYNHS